VWVVFGNFGNGTIALLQLLEEQGAEGVTVISIDMGWAAEGWDKRLEAADVFINTCGFTHIRLKSPHTFSEHVIERGSFPTQKFQSCALLLKGSTFNAWLDEVDPGCEFKILIGRRSDSRVKVVGEVQASPHFGGRDLLHPLAALDDEAFAALIERAGFEPLNHRSLECDPCIHNSKADVERISNADQKKLQKLEVSIDKSLSSRDNPDWNPFESGCGTAAIYGCGT